MGVEVPEAMKSTYCAVAVECTVRALEECEEDDRAAKYSDAVERIWRGRIKSLKTWKCGVVSESLNIWDREIELYLWDSAFSENLVENKNRSIDALKSVRLYVKDTEAKMGPPFLEVAADILISNKILDLLEPTSVHNAGHDLECDQVWDHEPMTTVHNASHDMECDQVRGNEQRATHNGGLDAIVNDRNIEGHEEDIPERSKHVGARRKSIARKSRGAPRTSRGVKIVDAEELDDEMPTAVRDDSIDHSVEGSSSRPHPPSPKKSVVTPLQEDQVNQLRKRRKRKPWSLLDEDTLRTGVETYGKGNWKLILTMYRDIFEERTEVDLKDKWRNLTR